MDKLFSGRKAKGKTVEEKKGWQNIPIGELGREAMETLG